MATDWNSKLRKLLDIASDLERRSALNPIAINLGIDFGTSFTKVCFRDLGAEDSGIITFNGKLGEDALIPSVVTIDRTGRLYAANNPVESENHLNIAYLKMRLANLAQNSIGENDTPGILCRALSSWFLATVIQRCQNWIYVHETDRIRNRKIIWSANVGVPVEQYDSPAVKTFTEVLGVAWRWVQKGCPNSDIDSVLDGYNSARRGLDHRETDCHPIPEIAAAIYSFIMSREAAPGIYIYYDIGGGTVDGVAFDFINDDGERRINFYSGKVRALGVVALTSVLGLKDRYAVSAIELQRIVEREANNSRLADFGLRFQQLVAQVIMEAKHKDWRNWQVDAIQNPYFKPKSIGALEPSRMRPLIIFVGGGGSKSAWYEGKIAATYKDFNHHQAGIPPYQLAGVPKPRDLDMRGIPDDDFRRFAIAYGLSIPLGEGPEIGFPSHFPKAGPGPTSAPKGVVDYGDTKDVFD